MADLQMVGFRVGRESFGIPIAAVHEILRVPEITSMPQAGGAVQGVINLRGRIIPVVDLRRQLGASAPQSSRKNRILVVEAEARMVGLIVDEASEVLRVPATEVLPAPQVLGGAEAGYITSVVRRGSRLVLVADLQKLLAECATGKGRAPAKEEATA